MVFLGGFDLRLASGSRNNALGLGLQIIGIAWFLVKILLKFCPDGGKISSKFQELKAHFVPPKMVQVWMLWVAQTEIKSDM